MARDLGLSRAFRRLDRIPAGPAAALGVGLGAACGFACLRGRSAAGLAAFVAFVAATALLATSARPVAAPAGERPRAERRDWVAALMFALVAAVLVVTVVQLGPPSAPALAAARLKRLLLPALANLPEGHSPLPPPKPRPEEPSKDDTDGGAREGEPQPFVAAIARNPDGPVGVAGVPTVTKSSVITTSSAAAASSSPAASSTVTKSSVTTAGRVPPESIQRIIRLNFGRFRFCYQEGLRSNPKLQGRVTVRLIIAHDGTVSSAHSSYSDLPKDVTECVEKAYRQLEFPGDPDGVVTTVYSIQFDPPSVVDMGKGLGHEDGAIDSIQFGPSGVETEGEQDGGQPDADVAHVDKNYK